MKKFLSALVVVTLCMNMIFIFSACGNDKKEEVPKETVIDLEDETIYLDQDGNKLSTNQIIEKYLSIDITKNLQPVKKSEFLFDLVKYSATGTVTATIEPISFYKMRLENVHFDLEIVLTFMKDDRDWQFVSGGNEEWKNQRKTIPLSIPSNGTSITENVKLEFLLDKFAATFVDVSNLSTLNHIDHFINNPRGKIIIYND